MKLWKSFNLAVHLNTSLCSSCCWVLSYQMIRTVTYDFKVNFSPYLLHPVLLCHPKKNIDRPCWVRSSSISPCRQGFPDKIVSSTETYHVGISTTPIKGPFLHRFHSQEDFIYSNLNLFFIDFFLLYWIPAQWIILNNSSLLHLN